MAKIWKSAAIGRLFVIIYPGQTTTVWLRKEKKVW